MSTSFLQFLKGLASFPPYHVIIAQKDGKKTDLMLLDATIPVKVQGTDAKEAILM